MEELDEYDDDLLTAFHQNDEFFEKIDEDLDYAFARSLQSQYGEEVDKNIKARSAAEANKGNVLSITDRKWETLDPNPDIHSLFTQFNMQFFWGKLSGVEVRWSSRMTTCAGVCCYEGRGGLCSVRLSMPLLRFRPRRDLVETLLHEMIHAYLFVTHNNKDHDSHGPEFHKHMYRINNETGTTISVYHNFHDEVELYRTHWWRCNGPCQHKRPYYGFVKRAMNRVPSARDPWWQSHQQRCNGTFIKIREPEDYQQRKGHQTNVNSSSGNSKDKSSKGLHNFFIPMYPPSIKNTSASTSSNYFSDIHDVSSLEMYDDTYNAEQVVPTGSANIQTLTPSSAKRMKAFVPFSGKGFTLGGSSSGSAKDGSIRNSIHTSKRPKLEGSGFKTSIGTSSMKTTMIPSKGQVRSKPYGTSGTSTLSSSGSKTVVLNKSPKTYTKTLEPSANGDIKKGIIFAGKGHKLNKSTSTSQNQTSTASPMTSKQKLLDNFITISPSRPQIQKKRLPRVIFSSDSEDEQYLRNSCDKTVSENKSQINTKMETVPHEDSDASQNVVCPVCLKRVKYDAINSHLDSCLGPE